MAIIKHKTSRNARYDDVLEYYSYRHYENVRTGHYEPIPDEYGLLQERDDYAVMYIDADGVERDPHLWAGSCQKTNLIYGKNNTKSERKNHEYIISHPASDRDKMSMDDLRAEAREFIGKFLGGYDAIIGIHRDTDNDHIHITIGSVRARAREEQTWMMCDANGHILNCELAAGGKHQDSPTLRRAMNEWLLEHTKSHGYEAKDNNAVADRRRQERYGRKNIEMRTALLDCAARSKSMEELACILEKDYGMLLKVSGTGNTIGVLYPGNQKYVRLRSMGLAPETLYRMLDTYSGSRKKYWQDYREIRDAIWEDFCAAQRKEFEKIKEYRALNTQLYIANSDFIGEGMKRKMHSPRKLKRSRYFELRAENDQAIAYHKERVELQRKYQAVAKGRQQIVCALLKAGADEKMIESALNNYREAMSLVESYLDDPKDDYEGRRLKAAQWSLEQAKDRAMRYIESLPVSAESCEQQQSCESVYLEFVNGEYSAENSKFVIAHNDFER